MISNNILKITYAVLTNVNKYVTGMPATIIRKWDGKHVKIIPVWYAKCCMTRKWLILSCRTAKYPPNSIHTVTRLNSYYLVISCIAHRVEVVMIADIVAMKPRYGTMHVRNTSGLLRDWDSLQTLVWNGRASISTAIQKWLPQSERNNLAPYFSAGGRFLLSVFLPRQTHNKRRGRITGSYYRTPSSKYRKCIFIYLSYWHKRIQFLQQ